MTNPDVQFKNIPSTKQKSRARTDYEWIGKIIFDHGIKKMEKKTENHCQNAACGEKDTSGK